MCILQLRSYFCSLGAHKPNITIEINNVPLGTNATFHCTHECDVEGGCREILWNVETKDGRILTTLELEEEMELNSRGIYRDGAVHQDIVTPIGSTDISTLEIQASQMNNESEITCTFFSHDISDSITLIVIGNETIPILSLFDYFIFPRCSSTSLSSFQSEQCF